MAIYQLRDVRPPSLSFDLLIGLSGLRWTSSNDQGDMPSH